MRPLIALTEEQYRFGIGPVVLHSPQVLARVEFDGEPWWHLRAQVAGGTAERHGGWVDRELYVPVGLLPSPHTP